MSLEKLAVGQLTEFVVSPSVDFGFDTVMDAILLDASATANSCSEVGTARHLFNLDAFQSFH